MDANPRPATTTSSASGNATTGILLDGLDRDPNTFDAPELAFNHALHAACDWEAGGEKWDVGR
jgi:hypothetical protein